MWCMKGCDGSVVVGELPHIGVPLGNVIDDSGEVPSSPPSVNSESTYEGQRPPKVLTQNAEERCFTGAIRSGNDRRPRGGIRSEPTQTDANPQFGSRLESSHPDNLASPTFPGSGQLLQPVSVQSSLFQIAAARENVYLGY